MHKLNRYQ